MRRIYQIGKVILAGDRPTGRLRVGHYVGSLRRRVGLQSLGEFGEIYIMIVGTQALTDNADNPEKVHQNIMEVALDYLTCGLGPEKPVLFIQSQMPELCEMMFYYMDLVTVSKPQCNPTVKSEIQIHNLEASIPAGFFVYSTSQAADIIAFRAITVPVGEDQAPTIEQTREIVHKFNSIYGETLVEPGILLPNNKACLCLPGIDGETKMSKSLGNCIYLPNSEDETERKIMSVFTDPNHLKVEDPRQVGRNPVLIYLDALRRDEHFEKYLPDYKNPDGLKTHYARGGLGDVKVKRFLDNVLRDGLRSIRERRGEIVKNVPAIYRILGEGSRRAEQKATQTLAKTKRTMKVSYFKDRELITEQTERFRTEMEQALYGFIRLLQYIAL